MEEKSETQRPKLNDLPSSEDGDFWLDAEIHTGLEPHDAFEDHKHHLELKTAHQAQCPGCGWGFELDPGDKVIDGHLYDKRGKFVI